ncbi:Nn.00g093630.m01.CDS01 [Neocucurbitaria sp. VM-36]
MDEPPPKLLYSGREYHPPANIFTAHQLHGFYTQCGAFPPFEECLRCGLPADDEHRLNWLECSQPCGLCWQSKHVGKSCSRMEMTYAEFFTPAFFAEHAGVHSVPWNKEFKAKYEAVRDRFSRGSGPGERGRQNPRDEKKSSRSTHKSNVRTSGRDKKDRRKRSRSVTRSASPEVQKRRKVQCYICKEVGHKAAKCPTKDKCRDCGREGHWAKDCPDRQCFNCQQRGHEAATCPEDTRAASAKKPLTGKEILALALTRQPEPMGMSLIKRDPDDFTEASNARAELPLRRELYEMERRYAQEVQAKLVAEQRAIVSEERAIAAEEKAIAAREIAADLEKQLEKAKADNAADDLVTGDQGSNALDWSEEDSRGYFF